MACEICEFKIGGNYRFDQNSPCQYCHKVVLTAGLIGTYEGLKGGNHIFKIHPKLTCPGCKEKLTHVYIPCTDNSNPIDVTNEFKALPVRIMRN